MVRASVLAPTNMVALDNILKKFAFNPAVFSSLFLITYVYVEEYW